MKLEKEIQEWVVRLTDEDSRFDSRDLYNVIRYDDCLLSQEMKDEVEQCRRNGGLAPSRHRAVREACRVLRSLVEPRFKSANTNISKVPGEVLKPDLVLEDEISGAFVVVELKRNKKIAREAATELLAYANCLLEQHPGSQVFLVLISTSWATIEQKAFAQLAQWRIPALALEYREADPHERTPTLLVRSDLLPVASVRPFASNALLVDTKVFWLPYDWHSSRETTLWFNRIEHAVKALVREAEIARKSGFVIVWHLRAESPSKSNNESKVRLFVSMAVRNPCRAQDPPEFKSEREAEDFAWSNTVTELIDDTAVRLLLELQIGENVEYDSPENEGTWDRLQARLDSENAHIVHFDGFGEIGDQVSSWRTQKHDALAPVFSDIASLKTWHPLTWLPALESLIDTSEQDEGDPLAWHAFRRGQDLGRVLRPNFRYRSPRHFGRAAALARFARTWRDFFASNHEAPNLFAQITPSGLRWSLTKHWERVHKFASCRVAEEGELARYCFALGYQSESGYNNVEYFVNHRYVLRKDGIHLPEKLEAMVEDLERLHRDLHTPSLQS